VIQIADTYTLPAALPLEEGGLLVNAQIAYHAWGELSGENSIVLLHDLVESHRALQEPETSPFRPSGWGRELIGVNNVLNPEQNYIVCPNLLGSPFGSTSAVTSDPRTGSALGTSFPALTVEDMARGLAAMLRGLKIRRVRAIAGVGLGGMVALRAASLFPDLAAGVVALGAAKSLPEGLREQLSLTGQFLRSDPTFKNGDYAPNQGPKQALQKLRLEMLRRVYGPNYLAGTDLLTTERQLEAEAEAFAEQFDANCYSHLCNAFGGADLTDHLPKIAARVLLIAGSDDTLAPPPRVRDTYHLLTAAGVNARYYELQSDGGHATLLAEAQRLRGPVGEFLAGL
jgi:homoserine O-acetyltransferase/O-succinyltransferase